MIRAGDSVVNAVTGERLVFHDVLSGMLGMKSGREPEDRLDQRLEPRALATAELAVA